MKPKEMRPQLVLVGGGHAHVQLLRKWTMDPVDADVTVVVDRPVAVYSGMVPAYVAGEIERHELEIDVVPLARRAGAAVIVDPVVGVDPAGRRLLLAERPPITYDLVSFDIGSRVAHADTPGVDEHAIASRPIHRLIEVIDTRLQSLAGCVRVVVVGSGAGGVELAFCLEARCRKLGITPKVTMVSKSAGSLSSNPRVAVAVQRAMAERGIGVVKGRKAVEVRADAVVLDDGSELGSELTLWVTGAAPHGVLGRSGLPVDGRGFLRVDEHLRVPGHPEIFAAGDCAVHQEHPWVPRAGVYAVRAGPVLAHNLEASLEGRPPKPFRPQRDFLSMLNLGDGTAIVGKWGLALRGAWVWRWKDRIDRSFMERFQVLGPQGEPDTPFGRWFPPMLDEDMLCGGCAAKAGPATLEAVLPELHVDDPDVLIGLADGDDVAEVRVGDSTVLATVDAFPAFTDDPWLVGLAAARNAVSDVLAKGGRARFALALVTLPEDAEPSRALHLVMHGAQQALADQGTTLVGGHTTVGPTLSVGFGVLGVPGPSRWSICGAVPGDALVLMGRLGTGVTLRGHMVGLLKGEEMQEIFRGIERGPRSWLEALRARTVHAVTDVTGFGLAGHLAVLMRASAATARICGRDLPALPGARRLLQQGVRSTADPGNRARSDVRIDVGVDDIDAALCFDPQTAGGFLAAMPRDEAEILIGAWDDPRRPAPRIIGRVVTYKGDGVRVWMEAP